jgi:glycosyltransferase involved in cell wall biosynthesis
MIRVLSVPYSQRNPYFRLFYEALARYGVAVSYASRLTESALEGPEAPDVVHIHWGMELHWRSGSRRLRREASELVRWGRILKKARDAGITVIWTVHELYPPENARWWDAIGYAMCGHAADLCICHSGHARDTLARRYLVPRRRTITVPIGTYSGVVSTEHSRDRIRDRFELIDGARLLVCFGDLRPRKGIEIAIEAARRLGHPYQLVIAGDAPSAYTRTWLADLQARTPLPPNVKLEVGRLDDQTLTDLIGSADCVLLPYLSIFGSSALSLCAALGRGVVASDLAYFREVLALEPDAGVLATPGDAVALAGAVQTYFATDPATRHAAAARLSDALAWENVVAPVAQWLNAHVSPRSRRSGSEAVLQPHV